MQKINLNRESERFIYEKEKEMETKEEDKLSIPILLQEQTEAMNEDRRGAMDGGGGIVTEEEGTVATEDKNEENIFDFQLFEILPQSIMERFYMMQREGQDTKKIASDIKDKIIAVIDKLFSATLKKTQTIEDIQRNANDIYRDHLSDKYFYNEIMNAFYTIDANGIFQIISSDEIFFAVRGNIPVTLQPLTLWRTLKLKIKNSHWLEFSPSSAWIDRSVEFCEGLVECHEEAKFLLFTLGCIVRCSTEPFEFNTLWMGDEEVAHRAMVFLQRLCSQYVGTGTTRLWANVKFLYKSSFPSHTLAFICFKSSNISHAISVIDNHAATFLCCAKKYAETLLLTNDLSSHFAYVFRMHKFQSTDVSSLFEYFATRYVKDVSQDVHLVHMNEVRQEFSTFLEKEKFPANIVSHESLKKVVMKTLRHSANNFYFGSLQIPSMYNQFLHFCQDCIHLNLKHPLVPRKKRITIGRIYKVYKLWHQQKYSTVLLQTEEENEKLSEKLLYQRVIEQFFEFKYGENMDDIELSEPGDIPMQLPETITAAVADEIEALVNI